MIVKPRFYDSFMCIASDCPDTCCAGWEIEVDADSHEYYNSLSGNDRDFVYSKLLRGENGEVLLCREGERCAFLRGDNLCELILRFGDRALCDICREHPRFYSWTENITEVGVGLCCPEATRLWLESPVGFACEDDEYALCEWENVLYARQMEIIQRISGSDEPLGKMLAEMIGDDDGDDMLYEKLRELYSQIELLDANFPKRFSPDIPHAADGAYKKLAAYFVYRYFFELGEEMCLRLAAASVIMIAAMGDDVALSAKDYSKEVEYDTDNLEKICEFLESAAGLGLLCKKVFA